MKIIIATVFNIIITIIINKLTMTIKMLASFRQSQMKCIGIDQSPTSKNFKQLCQTVKQLISKDIYSPHRIANKKIAEAFEVNGFQFFHFKL